jgi:hypothetical protein
MGAVILGRYSRVRWKPTSPTLLAQLEAGTASVAAMALSNDAEEAWGLASGQPALLKGSNVQQSKEKEKDGILILPERPDISSTVTLPSEGQWLIGIEHSGSMWSALRQVNTVAQNEISFDWKVLDMPGTEPLVMGRPQRGDELFQLVAPPPRNGAFPAQLSRDGTLLTAPFGSEIGKDDEFPPTELNQLNHYLDGICNQVIPRYRYGVLTDGVMRWLNLKPGVRYTTSTPATALFRTRLALFARELAARGIYYEDDAEETGYELDFAIEDGAVPPFFYEQEAALAYTVSGEGAPQDDKLKQARELYDPESDWETGHFYAIDYPAMPARVDVMKTPLVFYTSEFTQINGIEVNDDWARAHLEVAGTASGLAVGASDQPALTLYDVERLNDQVKLPLISGNAVDSADRVQRAAYALATGGAPDSAIEAQLSRFRGPIVRALLGHNALRAFEAGDQAAAEITATTLLPLAPGPFPARAYAVIKLADALADDAQRHVLVADAIGALNDPLQRRLALLFAERAGGAPGAIARGASTWVGEKGTEALIIETRGWAVEIVEPLLGTLEPPDRTLQVQADLQTALTSAEACRTL